MAFALIGSYIIGEWSHFACIIEKILFN